MQQLEVALLRLYPSRYGTVWAYITQYSFGILSERFQIAYEDRVVPAFTGSTYSASVTL